MRHRNSGRKLGRTASHRHAMFRNMVTSLFEHERIETTDARAKELRSIAEKLITQGKRGTLHARRNAAKWVHGADVLKKLFDDIAPRFAERPGGYTRIVKVGQRHGDNAPLSIIELVPGGRPAFKSRSGQAAGATAASTKESFSSSAE